MFRVVGDLGADLDIGRLEQLVGDVIEVYVGTVCSFECECTLCRFCFVNFYTPFFIPDGEQVEMV